MSHALDTGKELVLLLFRVIQDVELFLRGTFLFYFMPDRDTIQRSKVAVNTACIPVENMLLFRSMIQYMKSVKFQNQYKLFK